jgi:hypothetical protein
MGSPADFALWIVSVLLEAFACGLIVLRGRLRRYRMLAYYFAGCAVFDSVPWKTLFHYGLNSVWYIYFYYYADCLLKLLLYLVVVEHCGRVADLKTAWKYVRVGSFVLATCVGIFCSLVVARSSGGFMTDLVIEYSQSLFLVTTALGLIVCVPSLWKRGVLPHDCLLAFILASYLFLVVWQDLSRNLYPKYISVVSYSGTLLWMMLPLGVAYIFSDPATGNDGPYIYL